MLIYANLPHGVQKFSQISHFPDLIQNFWAKRWGLYAGAYGKLATKIYNLLAKFFSFFPQARRSPPPKVQGCWYAYGGLFIDLLKRLVQFSLHNFCWKFLLGRFTSPGRSELPNCRKRRFVVETFVMLSIKTIKLLNRSLPDWKLALKQNYLSSWW